MNLLLTSIVSLGSCALVWWLGAHHKDTPFWVVFVYLLVMCGLNWLTPARTRREGFNVLCSTGALVLAAGMTLWLYA